MFLIKHRFIVILLMCIVTPSDECVLPQEEKNRYRIRFVRVARCSDDVPSNSSTIRNPNQPGFFSPNNTYQAFPPHIPPIPTPQFSEGPEMLRDRPFGFNVFRNSSPSVLHVQPHNSHDINRGPAPLPAHPFGYNMVPSAASSGTGSAAMHPSFLPQHNRIPNAMSSGRESTVIQSPSVPPVQPHNSHDINRGPAPATGLPIGYSMVPSASSSGIGTSAIHAPHLPQYNTMMPNASSSGTGSAVMPSNTLPPFDNAAFYQQLRCLQQPNSVSTSLRESAALQPPPLPHSDSGAYRRSLYARRPQSTNLYTMVLNEHLQNSSISDSSPVVAQTPHEAPSLTNAVGNISLNPLAVDPDEMRRDRRRIRDQERRNSEAPITKKHRTDNNSAAQARRRAIETPEETQRRREQDATARQEARATETQEQTSERQQRDAAAHQDARSNETPEQTQNRRERDSSSTRRHRGNLNPEQQQQRREADRDAQRIRRAQMTDSQRAAANERRRNNYQRRRQEERDRTTLAAALDVIPERHNLGLMDEICSSCGALYFRGECKRSAEGTYDQCCNHSKVQAQLFNNFPQLLKDLFMGVHPESANFLAHIRNFNSSHAMASMNAQLKSMTGRGPFVFCVHGQINYHGGPALPQNASPSFGQLYFIDAAQAADERIGRRTNSSCSPTVMRQLSLTMAGYNPLCRAYKMMGDVYREEEARARANNSDIPQIKMVFINKSTESRVYNAPVANEVAVVYVGPDGDVPQLREFTVFLRGGGLTRLSVKNPKLDALTYPLFFPDGRDTWHPDLVKQNNAGFQRTRVTQANYYSFLLSVRRCFNPLHYGGKLLQQLAVDLWVRMESNSLEWIRHNQPKIRAECYQSLRDFVNDGEQGLAGSRIVLPSSHTGSPRHYTQQYQDCMTMVARYGKPDLFITMTTNSNWPEITQHLYPGQSANDRPDIVTRVFQQKWNALLKDITERHVLGEVIAFAFTIEWQKRGLPHAHLLVTLAQRHKLDNADSVDRIISAEIPDEQENPELYNAVKTHMIHRRCGHNDQHAPCLRNGKCSKNFPKNFSNTTVLESGQYPQYRRRDNGRQITIGNGSNAQCYDNRHVVSYSKYLLLKYNCHLNVESCSLIQVCKYLYKYVHKGVDKAVIQLRKQMRAANGGFIDEIDEHLDARYMCPPEAMHRIFKNKISGLSHSIERLEVHLPNYQSVTFQAGAEQQALDRVMHQNTTLQAYFDLNRLWNEKEQSGEVLGPVDPRSLNYLQIPEHFVFEEASVLIHKVHRRFKAPGNHHWKQRTNGGDRKIGRLMGVPVRDKERYALRMLLLKRKGCASFEELRTMDDHRFPTFEAAAVAMGLLHSNDAFHATLSEACLSEMPYQLRKLFCCLFIFYLPTATTSLQLWEDFADDLSEDYSRRGQRPMVEAHALAWFDISDALQVQGLDFEKFVPPPLPQRPADDINAPQIDHNSIATDMRSKLNSEQEAAALEILSNSGSRLIFVDGPGGSGKSFLYECVYHTLKAQGKAVICCAWTGIAASILPEGRTISSLFKLNKKNDNKTSSVKPNSKEGRQLAALDAIIIDEVSMLSSWCLEGIDQCLKDVCNTTESFGGKTILMGGDFRQVLPIPPKNSGIEPSQISLKATPLFSQFSKFSLSVNMRASNETREWKEFLMTVGNGTAPYDEDGLIEFPSDILSAGDLITEIYEGIFDDSEHLRQRAILCPRNFRVDEINNDILDYMDSQQMTYYSVDSLEQQSEQDQLEIEPEFLHQQTPRGFPLHQLRLKIGCVVMVMRNLNIKAGLCNGTRLQVIRFGRNFIQCRFIVGARFGEEVLIPRIELLTDDDSLAFKLRRRQFPLRLSFCMTINKSQGQSLEKVGIDLENDVFGHGQFYVALSRSTSKAGVKIFTKGLQAKAKNIVDTRVL